MYSFGFDLCLLLGPPSVGLELSPIYTENMMDNAARSPSMGDPTE